MSDLWDDCPDDAYTDYPMMCSGRVTKMKEAKMDEKIKEMKSITRLANDYEKATLLIEQLSKRVKELEERQKWIDCEHDLAEMETACADGLCPICLRSRIVELEEGIKKHKVEMWKLVNKINHPIIDADLELYKLIK
jgi:DNA repair exonuclease SbcCD ATPase subunit